MNALRKCAYAHYAAIAVWLLFIFISDSYAENRTLDGSNNNLSHPLSGRAGSDFLRLAPPAYSDGIALPSDPTLPNPRRVSNALFRQVTSHSNAGGLSGFVYAFGQFISHDMERTESGATEVMLIEIPDDDPLFQPGSVDVARSLFDKGTGTSRDNPREQINFATPFIDGSMIYGSDMGTSLKLRGGPVNPSAKLRTSSDINGDGQDLLPRDAFGPSFTADFVAGDPRANDSAVLTAMHTIFLREHNRLVDQLSVTHPDWTSDQLFERARKVVGAELQVITMEEFLPALLGPFAPSAHGKYDPDIMPGIFNEFPSVFLRAGHSMLPAAFQRAANDGTVLASLPLESAFQDPTNLPTSDSLDEFLKGLSIETQEDVDLGMVDAVRGTFLDSLDLVRAREHGIPGYNELRAAYGLPRIDRFSQMTSKRDVQIQLEQIYGTPDRIDGLVGALAEDHLPDSNVGPLLAHGLATQFTRLRDGDRFWYENDTDFTAADITDLSSVRLSQIIQRNSNVSTLQANVFKVPESSRLVLMCGPLLIAFRNRHATLQERRGSCSDWC